jgi:trans-aconitate 2-methyltransferase
MWDPREYLAFADERGRPFAELVSRVFASAPSRVVDLGSGPGNLTATLLRRWPDAQVIGVDSSVDMVTKARRDSDTEADAGSGRLEFTVADLREWQPSGPVDVLISNATLQWVPDHLDLLPGLLDWVAPGGWFAFQVPGNFGEPSHVLLRQVSDSPRWRDRVGAGVVARPDSHEPADYLAVLTAAGCRVDVWETTYLQVLPGEDAVVNWVRGTALRPVLAELNPEEQAEFLDEYATLLRAAYPRQSFGTVLPFRRIFAVAQKPGSGREEPRP